MATRPINAAADAARRAAAEAARRAAEAAARRAAEAAARRAAEEAARRAAEEAARRAAQEAAQRAAQEAAQRAAAEAAQRAAQEAAQKAAAEQAAQQAQQEAARRAQAEAAAQRAQQEAQQRAAAEAQQRAQAEQAAQRAAAEAQQRAQAEQAAREAQQQAQQRAQQEAAQRAQAEQQAQQAQQEAAQRAQAEQQAQQAQQQAQAQAAQQAQQRAAADQAQQRSAQETAQRAQAEQAAQQAQQEAQQRAAAEAQNADAQRAAQEAAQRTAAETAQREAAQQAQQQAAQEAQRQAQAQQAADTAAREAQQRTAAETAQRVQADQAAQQASQRAQQQIEQDQAAQREAVEAQQRVDTAVQQRAAADQAAQQAQQHLTERTEADQAAQRAAREAEQVTADATAQRQAADRAVEQTQQQLAERTQADQTAQRAAQEAQRAADVERTELTTAEQATDQAQQEVARIAQQDRGANAEVIADSVGEGKTLDQAAMDRGLTRQQVVDQLREGGLQVSETATSPRDTQTVITGGDHNITESSNGMTGASTIRTGPQDSPSGLRGPSGTPTQTFTDDGAGRTTASSYDPATGASNSVTRDTRAGTTETLDTRGDGQITRQVSQDVPGQAPRVTTETTNNGHVVTERPDGSINVRNTTLGTDVAVDANTPEAALAETLVDASPTSADPAVAARDAAVVDKLGGLFAGRAAGNLQNDADAARTALNDAIREYGAGTAATPNPDPQTRVILPFGSPPPGAPKSGGNWTPATINGQTVWVDPAVARAAATSAAANARAGEVAASAIQAGARDDVAALDPATAAANRAANTVINDALKPHGVSLNLGKPNISLAEARTRLGHADTLAEAATRSADAYERAIPLLDDAIAQNNALETMPEFADAMVDPAAGSVYNRALADLSRAQAAFGKVNVASTEGALAGLDAAIAQNRYSGVEVPAELSNLRNAMNDQLNLSRLTSDYLNDRAATTDWAANASETIAGLPGGAGIGFRRGADGVYYKPQGATGSDRKLGTLEATRLEFQQGQLVRVSTFSDAGDITTAVSDQSGRLGAIMAANPGSGLEAAQAQSAGALTRFWENRIGQQVSNLSTKDIPALQNGVNDALSRHGPGVAASPDGTLPGGGRTESIQLGSQEIRVAPAIAAQIKAGNLGALVNGDSPILVNVDITPNNGLNDPTARWVAPQLAAQVLDLQNAQSQLADMADFQTTLTDWRNGHLEAASKPSSALATVQGQDLLRLQNSPTLAANNLFQDRIQEAVQDIPTDRFKDPARLRGDVSAALGLDGTPESAEALDGVMEEIHDVGGASPQISQVPFFHVGANGQSQMALLAVRGADGATRYIDMSGKSFSDVNDFRDNNALFDGEGAIVTTDGLSLQPGADGRFALTSGVDRNISLLESKLDPLIGIGTGIATVLSFTPAAPVAAPLALAGATYLGARSVMHQANHLEHGGEWGDKESWMNMGSIVTTAMPLASSGFRTLGMLRNTTGLTGMQAFRGSIGALRSGDDAAATVHGFMRSTHATNIAAYATDVAAWGAGVPLMYYSGKDLVNNIQNMNGLQQTDGVLNFVTGAVGTLLGARGLAMVRPTRGVRMDNGDGPNGGAPAGSTPEGVPGTGSGRLSDQIGSESTTPIVVAGPYRPDGARGPIVVRGGGTRSGGDSAVSAVGGTRPPFYTSSSTVPSGRGVDTVTPARAQWGRHSEGGEPGRTGSEGEAVGGTPGNGRAIPAVSPGQGGTGSRLSLRSGDGATPREIGMDAGGGLGQNGRPPRVEAPRNAGEMVRMRPGDVSRLNGDQLRNLPRQAMEAMTTPQIRALTESQISQLTSRQLSALNKRQVNALNQEQLQAISHTEFAKLGGSFIKKLSADQASFLSPRQLRAMTDSQVKALSKDQLQAMKPEQFAAFGERQWKAMTDRQAEVLNRNQLSKVDPAMRPHMPDRLQGMLARDNAAQPNRPQENRGGEAAQKPRESKKPSGQNGDKKAEGSGGGGKSEGAGGGSGAKKSGGSGRSSGARDIRSMSPEQIGNMSLAELLALTPEEIRSLSPKQLAAINPKLLAKLGADFFSQLNADQLNGMTPDQVKALTNEQLNAIDPRVHSELAEPLQDRISEAKAATQGEKSGEAAPGARAENASNKQGGQDSGGGSRGGNDARNAGGRPNETQGGTQNAARAGGEETGAGAAAGRGRGADRAGEMGGVSTPRNADDMHKFNSDRMGELSDAQLRGMSPEVAGAMTDRQIANLSERQMSILNEKQIGAWDQHQVGVLNEPQIQAIRPEVFSKLGGDFIGKLKPEQASFIAPDQIGAMSGEQVKALSDPQLQAMKPEQFAAFGQDQWKAVTPEQASVIKPEQLSQVDPSMKEFMPETLAAKLSEDRQPPAEGSARGERTGHGEQAQGGSAPARNAGAESDAGSPQAASRGEGTAGEGAGSRVRNIRDRVQAAGQKVAESVRDHKAAAVAGIAAGTGAAMAAGMVNPSQVAAAGMVGGMGGLFRGRGKSETNLQATLDSLPTRGTVRMPDADRLLKESPHEFVLARTDPHSVSTKQGDGVINQWANHVLEFSKPSAETRALAQEVADITGTYTVTQRPNERGQWDVLTPTKEALTSAGKIEINGQGQLRLVGEDGSSQPVRAEDHLGHFLGRGKFKTAFELGDKVVVIDRQSETGLQDLQRQTDLLNQLSDMGAPHVARPEGITTVFGRPAFVMDRSVTTDGNISTMFGNDSKQLLWNHDTSLLSQQSVDSLKATKSFLVDSGVAISDLQFLVGKDGTFSITDPAGIRPAHGETARMQVRNFETIDGLINLAETKLNGQKLDSAGRQSGVEPGSDIVMQAWPFRRSQNKSPEAGGVEIPSQRTSSDDATPQIPSPRVPMPSGETVMPVRLSDGRTLDAVVSGGVLPRGESSILTMARDLGKPDSAYLSQGLTHRPLYDDAGAVALDERGRMTLVPIGDKPAPGVIEKGGKHTMLVSDGEGGAISAVLVGGGKLPSNPASQLHVPQRGGPEVSDSSLFRDGRTHRLDRDPETGAVARDENGDAVMRQVSSTGPVSRGFAPAMPAGPERVVSQDGAIIRVPDGRGGLIEAVSQDGSLLPVDSPVQLHVPMEGMPALSDRMLADQGFTHRLQADPKTGDVALNEHGQAVVVQMSDGAANRSVRDEASALAEELGSPSYTYTDENGVHALSLDTPFEPTITTMSDTRGMEGRPATVDDITRARQAAVERGDIGGESRPPIAGFTSQYTGQSGANGAGSVPPSPSNPFGYTPRRTANTQSANTQPQTAGGGPRGPVNNNPPPPTGGTGTPPPGAGDPNGPRARVQQEAAEAAGRIGQDIVVEPTRQGGTRETVLRGEDPATGTQAPFMRFTQADGKSQVRPASSAEVARAERTAVAQQEAARQQEQARVHQQASDLADRLGQDSVTIPTLVGQTRVVLRGPDSNGTAAPYVESSAKGAQTTVRPAGPGDLQAAERAGVGQQQRAAAAAASAATVPTQPGTAPTQSGQTQPVATRGGQTQPVTPRTPSTQPTTVPTQPTSTQGGQTPPVSGQGAPTAPAQGQGPSQLGAPTPGSQSTTPPSSPGLTARLQAWKSGISGQAAARFTAALTVPGAMYGAALAYVPSHGNVPLYFSLGAATVGSAWIAGRAIYARAQGPNGTANPSKAPQWTNFITTGVQALSSPFAFAFGNPALQTISKIALPITNLYSGAVNGMRAGDFLLSDATGSPKNADGTRVPRYNLIHKAGTAFVGELGQIATNATLIFSNALGPTPSGYIQAALGVLAANSLESGARAFRMQKVEALPDGGALPNGMSKTKALNRLNWRAMANGAVGAGLGASVFIANLLKEKEDEAKKAQQPAQPEPGPQTAPPSEGPAAEPPVLPYLYQQRVTPPAGLNVRATPGIDGEKQGALPGGVLVNPSGQTVRDATGREWTPVNGFTQSGRPLSGFVATDQLQAQPVPPVVSQPGQEPVQRAPATAASDDNGRFNPALEQQGRRFVIVQNGDSVGAIARREGVDVSDTVELNLDHLGDNAGRIYAGDRIYLPAA